MPTGIVGFFNLQKGYGFIEPEDGGKKVFVHHTAVADAKLPNLEKGQRLSFDLERKGDAVRAIHLKPL